MIQLRKLFYSLFKNPLSINKIAFYINEEYIFDHYKNVMGQLEKDKFEIVLSNKFKSIKYIDFINKIKAQNWTLKYLDDVFWIKKYKCLITTNYFGGETSKRSNFIRRLANILINILNYFLLFFGVSKKIQIKKQYFQNILGHYNIRFMYGADVGGEKFGLWNELFDLFFCHGPNDAEMIKDSFKKPVYEMGYPRYDDYFNANKNIEVIKNKFHCNNDKKTILWICTVSEYFSTIETYHLAMKKLALDYNIIIRPHPLEIDKQYDRYNENVDKIVNNGDYILNNDPFQDMVELYHISDFVICDYGGTIFSALYMKQNILLLNHAMVYKDLGIYTSTSMDVREDLLNINEDESHKIKEYIEDNELWEKSRNKMEKVRSFYFGDHFSDSASKAAAKLRLCLDSNL